MRLPVSFVCTLPRLSYQSRLWDKKDDHDVEPKAPHGFHCVNLIDKRKTSRKTPSKILSEGSATSHRLNRIPCKEGKEEEMKGRNEELNMSVLFSPFIHEAVGCSIKKTSCYCVGVTSSCPGL